MNLPVIGEGTRVYLEELTTPLSNILGVTKLPEHAYTIFLSFFLFLSVHQVFAPVLSRRWFPEAFGKSGRRARNNWSIHVVSQVHAVIIVPGAWMCLGLESLDRDRAFGWHDRVGFVQAIACGYFLWDSLDAIINFIDIGFVIHGLACLAIYALGFKPFVAYYGVRCLFWESSTFFLNIHWFLDKTGRTGSTFQLVNGICLLATFFGARIIYGGKISYLFLYTLYDVRNELPLAYVIIYGIGNVTLQALNWFWFAKMIIALRKRFTDTPSKKRVADGAIMNGNGKVANGKHP